MCINYSSLTPLTLLITSLTTLSNNKYLIDFTILFTNLKGFHQKFFDDHLRLEKLNWHPLLIKSHFNLLLCNILPYFWKMHYKINGMNIQIINWIHFHSIVKTINQHSLVSSSCTTVNIQMPAFCCLHDWVDAGWWWLTHVLHALIWSSHSRWSLLWSKTQHHNPFITSRDQTSPGISLLLKLTVLLKPGNSLMLLPRSDILKSQLFTLWEDER